MGEAKPVSHAFEEGGDDGWRDRRGREFAPGEISLAGVVKRVMVGRRSVSVPVLGLRGGSRSEDRVNVPRRLAANEGRSPMSEERESVTLIGDGRGGRRGGRSEADRASREFVVSSACSLDAAGLEREVERRREEGRRERGDAGSVGTGDGFGEGLRLDDRGEGRGEVE